MAIDFPIDLPTVPAFQASDWTYGANTAVHRSPLSRVEQVEWRPGDVWEGVYTLPPMPRELAALWTAKLTSLRGEYGTFLGYDPDARWARGAGGTALVQMRGAQNAGSLTIETDGWPPNLVGVLLAGDYLSIAGLAGPELKLVLADVDAGPTGRASIEIGPPLHRNMPDNAAIRLIDPVGVFRLGVNKTSWSTDEASIYGISFPVIEALGISIDPPGPPV